MEKDEPEDRIKQADIVVQGEERNERHLHRHDQQRNNAEEEPIAAWELEPGKGVSRECCEEKSRCGGADRHPEGSGERRGNRFVGENVFVVFDRQQGRPG